MGENRWCANCEHRIYDDEAPNYCPECGEEWETKSADHVDWPVETELTARFDVFDVMEHKFNVSRTTEGKWSDWTDSYPVYIPVRIHRDGTIELREDSGDGDG